MILSPAHLDLPADVAGTAVSSDWWTFNPTHISIWENCVPHRANLCFFPSAMRNTEITTETLIPPCLRGLVFIWSVGFSQKLILWGSWMPVPLWSLMKHQLTVGLLVSFLLQHVGAVPFILELSFHACLVNGVFAIHSFPSHTCTCAHTTVPATSSWEKCWNVTSKWRMI